MAGFSAALLAACPKAGRKNKHTMSRAMHAVFMFFVITVTATAYLRDDTDVKTMIVFFCHGSVSMSDATQSTATLAGWP
jgi:hypothetical protein